MISIGADGAVYPCHMLHIADLKLGNILEKELSKIVFSSNNPFLNLDVNHIDGCQECKYGNFCGGGCRARSYLKQGIFIPKAIFAVSVIKRWKKFFHLKKAYGM